MLKQLRIQNFKLWQDTGAIKMAPISLFFGTNSSGKSSIGQFLMMLKQTVQSADRRVVLDPGDRNSAVQLGSYREMVFQREPKHEISFFYLWELPKEISDAMPLCRFSATVGLSNITKNILKVSRFEYAVFKKGNEGELDKILPFATTGMSLKPGKREYRFDEEPSEFFIKQEHAQSFKEVIRFYGFPDEVIAASNHNVLLRTFNYSQNILFSNIYYLGPLRTRTDRLYIWGGNAPESVGFSGENTIAAILAAEDRKISLGYRKRAKPFTEIIAEKLKEMGLLEGFEVSRIADQRMEYEVKVWTKGSRHPVNLPDVGVGISQVLPVLVQCFYAPAGSIILMEQPEIHLHPSAQSALADVMIDVIHSREGGKDRNIQLIIETHSEHFLRRLQRRIAEDKLPKEKVSAYFANLDSTSAKLESLQVDEYGHIHNWPENFFGDDMGDIIEQSEAAMKRRMAQAKTEGSA